MKTEFGIWRCDCATNNSDIRMRCRYCGVLRPIPEGVYYGVDGANFYDASRHGMGVDFYVFWRGRAAEFPRAPDAPADGFNAYGSGPVPIAAREPVEPDVLDMRCIGSGATLIDPLASIDIDQIALECAQKIIKLTAVEPVQMVAKIQVEVRAAIAKSRSAPDDLPFQRKDILRGLILFRTSNNAHDSINFVIRTSKVDELPQVAKDELAALLRSVAADIAPVDSGGMVHWNAELEAARVGLCEYWIDLADKIKAGKAIRSAEFAAKAIETEQALTILGDMVRKSA